MRRVHWFLSKILVCPWSELRNRGPQTNVHTVRIGRKNGAALFFSSVGPFWPWGYLTGVRVRGLGMSWVYVYIIAPTYLHPTIKRFLASKIMQQQNKHATTCNLLAIGTDPKIFLCSSFWGFENALIVRALRRQDTHFAKIPRTYCTYIVHRVVPVQVGGCPVTCDHVTTDCIVDCGDESCEKNINIKLTYRSLFLQQR